MTDLATSPRRHRPRRKAGTNDLVLVRVGDTVNALHAVCSHAGGPLAAGHGRRRLHRVPVALHRVSGSATAGSRHGPALYDQPAYEIRAAEGGGYEVRRGRLLTAVVEIVDRRPEPRSSWSAPPARASRPSRLAISQPFEILSSDAFRAIVSGDAADQAATRAAFARLHGRWTRDSRAGGLAVVDATNVERGSRRACSPGRLRAGVPSTAIVFDLPPETVLARNAARTERVVDPPVVDRHLTRLRELAGRTRSAPDPRGLRPGRRAARSRAEVEALRLRRRS